jgi:hypothetical protein
VTSYTPRSDTRADPASAKALNKPIRRLASMLPGGLDHEYGFACECGCDEIVARSAADFERDGGGVVRRSSAPLQPAD